MYSVKSRFACLLFLLLGTSVRDARGGNLPNLLPGVQESVVEDTERTEKTSSARQYLINPEEYSLQGRYRPRNAYWGTDSIGWVKHASLGLFSGAFAHMGISGQGSVARTSVDLGFPIGLVANYQFAPMHGARLLYQYNRFMYRQANDVSVNELGLGYMFNFTNYFKGYDPNKRLHVSATATAFAAASRRDNGTNLSARGEIGLLFDYKVMKGVSLFAEPYAGVGVGGYIAPGRYEVVGGVRAGVSADGYWGYMFNKHVRAVTHEKYQTSIWGDHVFIGGSAGLMGSNAERLPDTRRRIIDANAYLGYRFTPVHALRLHTTYMKGSEALRQRHRIMGELDYMIHFTDMWRGYDPKRVLRIFGTLGAGARYLPLNGGALNGGTDQLAPMLTASMGLSCYVTPQISLFVEPHGGVAFSRNGAERVAFGGIRGGLQVSLIDSHIYMSRFARTPEDIETAKNWKHYSHFFLGAGGGLMQNNNHDRIMPLRVFAGYRFTPVQSLRLQATSFQPMGNASGKGDVMGELDYMLNFSNLFYGYSPTRILNVSAYVGGGMKTSDAGKALALASGLDLLLRVYKGIGIFVEPNAYVSYAHARSKYELGYGINGGVAINLYDFDKSHIPGNERMNFTPFFEATTGWMFPLQKDALLRGSGLSLDVRLGTWALPAFGFRGSLVAQNFAYSRFYSSQKNQLRGVASGYANASLIKARLEGLVNPFNLIPEWRKNADNKRFELNISAGIEFGRMARKYVAGPGGQRGFFYGLTLAPQLLYKCSYNTAFFVEPRYEAMNHHGTASRQFDNKSRENVVTINAGVRIVRGLPKQRAEEPRLDFKKSLICGVNVGGYKAITTYKRNNGGRLGSLLGLNVGYLFTPLHAVKLSLQPSWYKAKGTVSDKYTLVDCRLAYMLNFSNLYQGTADRKVDTYLQLGGVWSTVKARTPGASRKQTPGVMGGFLIAYNINKQWAVTAEPIGQISLRKGFLPGYGMNAELARYRADISVGTIVKF